MTGVPVFAQRENLITEHFAPKAHRLSNDLLQINTLANLNLRFHREAKRKTVEPIDQSLAIVAHCIASKFAESTWLKGFVSW